MTAERAWLLIIISFFLMTAFVGQRSGYEQNCYVDWDGRVNRISCER